MHHEKYMVKIMERVELRQRQRRSRSGAERKGRYAMLAKNKMSSSKRHDLTVLSL